MKKGKPEQDRVYVIRVQLLCIIILSGSSRSEANLNCFYCPDCSRFFQSIAVEVECGDHDHYCRETVNDFDDTVTQECSRGFPSEIGLSPYDSNNCTYTLDRLRICTCNTDYCNKGIADRPVIITTSQGITTISSNSDDTEKTIIFALIGVFALALPITFAAVYRLKIRPRLNYRSRHMSMIESSQPHTRLREVTDIMSTAQQEPPPYTAVDPRVNEPESTGGLPSYSEACALGSRPVQPGEAINARTASVSMQEGGLCMSYNETTVGTETLSEESDSDQAETDTENSSEIEVSTQIPQPGIHITRGIHLLIREAVEENVTSQEDTIPNNTSRQHSSWLYNSLDSRC